MRAANLPANVLVMKSLLIVFGSLLLVNAAATAETRCKDSPKLVAQCYETHGRLVAANGTPGLRIWKVGTKRMLGVLDYNGDAEGETILPSSVEARLHPERGLMGWEIHGDYLVCPLTKERAGWMQMVCIESASKLVTKDLRPAE